MWNHHLQFFFQLCYYWSVHFIFPCSHQSHLFVHILILFLISIFQIWRTLLISHFKIPKDTPKMSCPIFLLRSIRTVSFLNFNKILTHSSATLLAELPHFKCWIHPVLPSWLSSMPHQSLLFRNDDQRAGCRSQQSERETTSPSGDLYAVVRDFGRLQCEW